MKLGLEGFGKLTERFENLLFEYSLPMLTYKMNLIFIASFTKPIMSLKLLNFHFPLPVVSKEERDSLELCLH